MNSDTNGISRRAPPKTCIYIDTHGISNNCRGSGFQMYLGYTGYILSESAMTSPGIYLEYSRYIPEILKSCNLACSFCAIGIQRHTGFGLQGCLMFIIARAVPTGHRSARNGIGAPPPSESPSRDKYTKMLNRLPNFCLISTKSCLIAIWR